MVHLSVLLEPPVTYTNPNETIDFDTGDADVKEDSEKDVEEGDAEHDALEQDWLSSPLPFLLVEWCVH